MQEILQYLKKNNGERMDLDIAKATGIPLESVRRHVTGLAATGQIITCRLTKYVDGKTIEGWSCRVSGYIPPAAPGRKPKAGK